MTVMLQCRTRVSGWWGGPGGGLPHATQINGSLGGKKWKKHEFAALSVRNVIYKTRESL